MTLLVIEFSEHRWNNLSAESAIDMMEWIVSLFKDNYEMRKFPHNDIIHFIGESDYPTESGAIHSIGERFDLIRTGRNIDDHQ